MSPVFRHVPGTGIFVNEMRRAFSTRSEAGASGEVLLKRRARSQVLIDARAYYDASLFQGFGSGASAFFGAPPTAPIGSQSYRLWSKLDDAKVNSSRRSTTFDNAIDAATEEPDDEADEDAVAACACMEIVAPQPKFIQYLPSLIVLCLSLICARSALTRCLE